MSNDSTLLAKHAAKLAGDKKAIDIRVLDLRPVAGFTDFFVICSAGSDRQIKAIHDAVREGIKQDFGRNPDRVDGERDSNWVLMDYGDAMVHIMSPEARGFYRLEQLWADAEELKAS